MAFTVKTRYGASERYDHPASAPIVVERLLHELETEEFEEPDDEHTQVAVGFGDWSVTAQVSGLLTFSHFDPHLPPEQWGRDRHLRATSRAQVKHLLLGMAEGRVQDVQQAGWLPFEQLPPYQEDLFRKPGPP